MHSQKTGDSYCFCNTDLCNGPRKKRVGGRYGKLLSFIFDFLSLSVIPHLQVGRDLWNSKMVRINLSFDNDLQPEHSWNSLLILHPEQFMSSFQYDCLGKHNFLLDHIIHAHLHSTLMCPCNLLLRGTRLTSLAANK